MFGLVVFGGLALVMLAYSPTGFDSQAVPAAADSAKGQVLLAAHYPTAESDPTDVLFRLPVSVWDDPALLTEATRGLPGSGQFTLRDGSPRSRTAPR